MTVPSQWLLQRVLTPRGIKPSSVLDFGAGKSHDDEMWKKMIGAGAWGYDRHPFPGFEHRTQRPPPGGFELVTMNYVLNILATEQERAEALQDAATFVAPGGLLWVSTRSKSNVDREVTKRLGKKNEWVPTAEGAWISSPSRGTVQFGMDEADIVALAQRSGLSGFTHNRVGRPNSWTGSALFRRR
jgi:hypothetical protein